MTFVANNSTRQLVAHKDLFLVASKHGRSNMFSLFQHPVFY